MLPPTAQPPTSTCEALSLHTRTILSKFPANPALAAASDKIGAAIQTLTETETAFTAAEAVLTAARAETQFADHAANAAVAALQLASEAADVTLRIAALIFPDGVLPIAKPIGTTQVTELRDLETRLRTVETRWSGAAAELSVIVDHRTRYESALECRWTAMERASYMRAVRDAAKEDFIDIYTEVARRIQDAFPDDRRMQDLFFDHLDGAIHDDRPVAMRPLSPAPPAPAPGAAPAQRPFAATLASPGGAVPELFRDAASPTPAAPGEAPPAPGPMPAPVEFPALTVEQYAALVAELSADAANEPLILAKYSIPSDEVRRALDAHWNQRFIDEPALRKSWIELCGQYAAGLTQKTR